MKKLLLFSTLKIFTLLIFFTICEIHLLFAQCANQVIHLSGTMIINGTNVTVTSSGKVWSSNFYCTETLPYFIGVDFGAASGNGSYSFNFSPAVDSVKLNFSGISNVSNGREIIILKKNGLHYEIPAAGLRTVCDTLAVLTNSGDIIGCQNCGVSGWKGTIIPGPIISLEVLDSVVPAYPHPGGSLFSLFIYSMCTTPVKFLYCDAEEVNNMSRVNWKTSLEQNVLEFEIKRSTDGINFIKIGAVQSNNSLTGGSYFFLDKKPVPGINYYRVDSKDIDGAITSCQINAVRFIQKKNEIRVFPIPTSDVLNIEGDFAGENLDIQVIDITGRSILQTRRMNRINTNLSLINLPDGFYTLKICSENDVFYRKILKQ